MVLAWVVAVNHRNALHGILNINSYARASQLHAIIIKPHSLFSSFLPPLYRCSEVTSILEISPPQEDMEMKNVGCRSWAKLIIEH